MKKMEKSKKSTEKQILKRINYRPLTMDRLKNEIENLILEGKDLNNKISREIQRKCHLYGKIKEIYGEPKKIIEETWKSVSEDLKKRTPKEVNHLRLLKKQFSLIKKRSIIGPKPFDEFNESIVLAAEINETINRKEALILKYRYNSEGYRISSLKLVAGWFGISHTTVMNIEKRALKKIQEEFKLLKLITVRSPERKEMSKAEYKRRFGYYPLD